MPDVDLTKMRDRPVGSPYGFSMKRFEPPEKERAAFMENVKGAFQRPISVGIPGMYFTPAQTAEGPRLLKSGELPEGYAALDPLSFGVGALTRAKGLKAMRRLIKKDTQRMLKAGRYPKQAVLAGHRVRLAEAKKAAEDIPEWMWGRVEDVVEETGTTSGAHRVRPSIDPAMREVDIGLNPDIFDYQTVMHELVGHEGSAAIRQHFTRPGAPKGLKRFGRWWGHAKDEMKAMEAALENADLTIEAERLYKWNPDEIYSTAVAGKMDKGMGLADAKKAAAKEMYKHRYEIMFNVKRGLESIRELAAARGVDIDVGYYLGQYYKQ